MRTLEINIAGDFYVGEEYLARDLITPPVRNFFSGADLNILNFESPVQGIIRDRKILKTGPHLSSGESAIALLKQMKINLVTLANNHILDYGRNGLEKTLSACSENSIGYVGAGLCIEEVLKPYQYEKHGIRISILNFAENEWANAGIDDFGANPLDVVSNIRMIREEKSKGNIVIVVIHGGHEFYPLPGPRMVKQYRFYADNGADLIVNHHQHCISGYEIYHDVPIFYGLGNFLFTLPSASSSWYTGLIIKLKIGEDRRIDFSLHPVSQHPDDFTLQMSPEVDRTGVLKVIAEYNKIIADQIQLTKSWNDFVEKNMKTYVDFFNPLNCIGNTFIRNSLFRLGFGRFFTGRERRAVILNIIRCESHYEMAIASLHKSIVKP